MFLVEVKSSSASPWALHTEGDMREKKSKRGQEETLQREEEKKTPDKSDLAIKFRVDKQLLLFYISVCIYMCACL